MGSKSAGVYITEKDISNYSVTDGSTVVALVGYATKGPIGKPVSVSTYQTFVEKFGNPTIVGYSGLAVKNIFASGASVIFYRVADESASVSKYIVKNAVAAVNGYQTFSKNTDVLVGSNSYTNGSIYAVNIAESIASGPASKTFYVRSPMSGKLAISDIVGQLSAQVGATAGYHEIALEDNYATAGMYSFNIQVDSDVAVSSTTAQIGGTTEASCFVELTSADKYDTVFDKISTAAFAGSNPVAVLGLAGDVGVTSTIGVISSGSAIANCQFDLTVNSVKYTIDVAVSASTTYSNLVTAINKVIKNYGAFCMFETDVTNGPRLIFVSKTKGSGSSISISSVATPSSGKQNLFIAANGVTLSNFTNSAIVDINNVSLTTYKDIAGVSTTRNSSDSFNFSIELDSYTKGLKVVSNKTGITSKAKIIKGGYGTELSASNIGNLLNTVDGTAAIDLVVERDSSTKKIKVSSKTSAAPVITAYSGASYITSLDKILLAIDTGISGNEAVSASEKDIVIISSKETGDETSKYSVEKVTIENPIDSTETVNIYVYYDDVIKESFNDVSLDKNASNRFDIVINNTYENGGSEHVSLEFIKNESGNIVNFPDGVYKIGNANKTNDVAATETTDFDDYLSYDYAVGTNGIATSGGEDLFVDALSVESDLANTELYNFHVLVTPDNIEESVQQAAIELAEFRKDFIYVCDPPFGLSSSGVKRWHNGQGFGRAAAIDSSYAATYWPWVKLYDTANKKYVWCPPSTVVAAKYASVDKTYGSWFAPAGELRGRLTVSDIEYSAKLSERDDIYTGLNRVNPIIKFNDGRTVIFGEKTCLRDSTALAKIHTRRMVLDIKKQVRSVLQSYLFMPNVSEVWSKAASALNAILEPYKRGGGISYYNVVVDSTTTTAEMQQQDILCGTIHIIPCGVIEDIEISLNIDKVGNTVSVE